MYTHTINEEHNNTQYIRTRDYLQTLTSNTVSYNYLATHLKK